MSNKRYYWLKLKEDFFGDKAIKKLRKIAGGDTYTIIYLKLLLRSMKTDGKLYYDGVEETFSDELALDIDEDKDNVKMTVMYLIKSGLLKEVTEQEIEMTRLNEMVGSETEKAELMRRKRARDKLLESKDSNNVTKALPSVTKRYTEKEKDLDLESELDLDLEEERNEKKYGKYKNVILTDDEYNKLKDEFPKDYEQRIEKLSMYIKSKGVNYENHLATIELWASKEQKEDTSYNTEEEEMKKFWADVIAKENKQ